MALKLSDVWRWDGAIDRGPYAAWGCLLMAVKYNLDRFLAALFGRKWHLFSYLRPGEAVEGAAGSTEAATFYGALIALAIPFIWAGTALTLRRLRSLELPPQLVVLFFVPLVNLLFFAVLCVLPAHKSLTATPEPTAPGKPDPLDRLMPHSALGSGAMAIAVTALVAVALTVTSVHVLGQYGWGLFVGIPFTLGLAATLLYAYRTPRTLGQCLGVSATAILLTAATLFALAVEGVICLVMAAPLGLGLALMGGTLGYFIQRRGWSDRAPVALGLVMMLLLPVLMGAEARQGGPAPVIAVKTTIDIDAPPSAVWHHVIAFSALPPPTDWASRLGVAYPMRAEIRGTGVGAVRHCVFSTGPFIEPITVWNPPHRLAFDVKSQPPSMKELSPFAVKAPHLDHFLVSQGGQFLLTDLPGGRTRLEGTTWYRHNIWPGPYWQVWSDAIIHGIHRRVLTHIRSLAETPQAASR